MSSVEACHIDATKDVLDSCGVISGQDGGVDARCLAVFAAQGAPLPFAVHDLVAMKLSPGGDVVVCAGRSSSGFILSIEGTPLFVRGYRGPDEVEVAVIRLIKVCNKHGCDFQ